MSITYRLMPHLDALLRPERLITVDDIVAGRRLIPSVGGIYGWWFRDEIPYVPLEGTLSCEGHRLLYIGIAPRQPSRNGSVSSSNLRKRICRDHLGTRIAHSTLRRSLAALLSEEIGLEIWRNDAGKRIMSPQDESELTRWMCENAAISLMASHQPWIIETELLANAHTVCPINIVGTIHRFRERMMERRRHAFRQDTH